MIYKTPCTHGYLYEDMDIHQHCMYDQISCDRRWLLICKGALYQNLLLHKILFVIYLRSFGVCRDNRYHRVTKICVYLWGNKVMCHYNIDLIQSSHLCSSWIWSYLSINIVMLVMLILISQFTSHNATIHSTWGFSAHVIVMSWLSIDCVSDIYFMDMLRWFYVREYTPD